MTATLLINRLLPGFEPPVQKTDTAAVPTDRTAGAGSTGRSLEEFGPQHARAVHDLWQTDTSYPLHSHLFDYLVRNGFALTVESSTDREIYNGLFDWINSLGTEER